MPTPGKAAAKNVRLTKTELPVAPTIEEIAYKVIAKEYGEWRYSWRVVVVATPHSECDTRVTFVDDDDFEVESDFNTSTVPSSGRLVVRGTTDINEDLARTIGNVLASIRVYPNDPA